MQNFDIHSQYLRTLSMAAYKRQKERIRWEFVITVFLKNSSHSSLFFWRLQAAIPGSMLTNVAVGRGWGGGGGGRGVTDMRYIRSFIIIILTFSILQLPSKRPDRSFGKQKHMDCNIQQQWNNRYKQYWSRCKRFSTDQPKPRWGGGGKRREGTPLRKRGKNPHVQFLAWITVGLSSL